MKRNKSWAVYEAHTGRRVSRHFKHRGNAVKVASEGHVVLSTTPKIFRRMTVGGAAALLVIF